MRYKVYGITHTGIVRSNNEDNFVLCMEGANPHTGDEGEVKEVFDGNFLAAVADGMGGLEFGEMASRIAVDELSRLNIRTSVDFKGTLEDINKKIISHSDSCTGAVKMGTTLTGFQGTNNGITIFNIGDSRVYRFRDGFIKQLTKDQTFVQYLFDCGTITRDQLKSHPDKNILFQCLGGSAKGKKIEPEIIELNGGFYDGDIFLVCSDGLYNMVDEDAMERIIAEENDLSKVGSKLLTEAMKNGGEDNITIVLVKCCEGRSED